MKFRSINRCKVRQWLSEAYEAVQADKGAFDPAIPGLLLDVMMKLDFPQIPSENLAHAANDDHRAVPGSASEHAG